MIYRKYVKRLLDVLLSFLGIVILSPILLLFTLIGAFKMKGNPFFIQERPGKDEKLFNLIKFRTMNMKKDKDGNLLPDLKRLTNYGKFLRNTSIDELPELINIFKGDMSIVGPRPLLTKYLPLYNEEQRKRHNVRPGLTGYAQVNGRNSMSWKEIFELDNEYVDNVTFKNDFKIFVDTFLVVLKRKGIDSNENSVVTRYEFTGNEENND